MNNINSILSFIIGGDYELLRQCPYEFAAQKILMVQKQIIDKLVEEWSKDTESDIANNATSYMKIGNGQIVKIDDASCVELDRYVSELVTQKQKEFAEIIISNWAESKKSKLRTIRNH